jgi:hypothetical protein
MILAGTLSQFLLSEPFAISIRHIKRKKRRQDRLSGAEAFAKNCERGVAGKSARLKRRGFPDSFDLSAQAFARALYSIFAFPGEVRLGPATATAWHGAAELPRSHDPTDLNFSNNFSVFPRV